MLRRMAPETYGRTLEVCTDQVLSRSADGHDEPLHGM